MVEQHLEILRNYQQLFDDLLASQAIKYSAWPIDDPEKLKNCSGVYHFYQMHGDNQTSLYVGKAAISENNWNLYKRLCQHFQPSQANALLGKASKQTGRSATEIKEEYMNADVYLQWLTIADTMTDSGTGAIKELIWLECFCKSILKPLYTDL